MVSSQCGSIALLEDWRFLVVSEHFPADVHDLAEGRVCPDRLDDGIHRVGLLILDLVPVDTYDDPVSLLQLLLVTVGRFGNLALKETRLDSVQQPPSTFYLVKVLESLLLHLIREPLDVVGSAERVNSVRHARLLGYDLLCPQRDCRRLF